MSTDNDSEDNDDVTVEVGLTLKFHVSAALDILPTEIVLPFVVVQLINIQVAVGGDPLLGVV